MNQKLGSNPYLDETLMVNDPRGNLLSIIWQKLHLPINLLAIADDTSRFGSCTKSCVQIKN